jgi:phage FluMu protein Com
MQSRLDGQNKTGDPRDNKTQLRCHCGSLLARLVAEGVQIKCRRCKRHVILSIETKRAVRIAM